jgi:hypothetical protein
VGPEGFSARLGIPVSPDGRQYVAYNEAANAWNVCGIEDGKCEPLRGSEDDDSPIQWSADGKYIYISVTHPETSLWRVELATGRREIWKRVTPGDSVGALEIIPAFITPDGKSFATQYIRSLDQLYVVEGLD